MTSVSELPSRPAEVVELPAPRAPEAPADRPVRRWPGYALVASGVALVPWLVVLATGLPSTADAPHWTVAWVGLDSMEAVGLVATGVLTLRRHQVRAVVAAATAMLLVVDAWFDVTTSGGSDIGVALAMALAAELPLAAVCAVVAVRELSPGAGRTGPDRGSRPVRRPGKESAGGQQPSRRAPR